MLHENLFENKISAGGATMGDNFEFIPQRGYCAVFETLWPHSFIVNSCIAMHYKIPAWLQCENIVTVATKKVMVQKNSWWQQAKNALFSRKS